MNYADAVKKVRAEKPKENFMTIRITDSQLVLPHKDAVTLLATLANAESFDKSWGSDRRIVPLNEGSYEANPMSRQKYEQFKIAALLNISIDELNALAISAQQQPTP